MESLASDWNQSGKPRLLSLPVNVSSKWDNQRWSHRGLFSHVCVIPLVERERGIQSVVNSVSDWNWIWLNSKETEVIKTSLLSWSQIPQIETLGLSSNDLQANITCFSFLCCLSVTVYTTSVGKILVEALEDVTFTMLTLACERFLISTKHKLQQKMKAMPSGLYGQNQSMTMWLKMAERKRDYHCRASLSLPRTMPIQALVVEMFQSAPEWWRGWFCSYVSLRVCSVSSHVWLFASFA